MNSLNVLSWPPAVYVMRSLRSFLANVPLSHQPCCWQVILFPLLSKAVFPFQCSSYSQLSFTIQNNSLTSILLYYKYFHPLFHLFCKLYIIGSFSFSLWSWHAIYFSILLLSFIEFSVIYFNFSLMFPSYQGDVVRQRGGKDKHNYCFGSKFLHLFPMQI